MPDQSWSGWHGRKRKFTQSQFHSHDLKVQPFLTQRWSYPLIFQSFQWCLNPEVLWLKLWWHWSPTRDKKFTWHLTTESYKQHITFIIILLPLYSIVLNYISFQSNFAHSLFSNCLLHSPICKCVWLVNNFI